MHEFVRCKLRSDTTSKEVCRTLSKALTSTILSSLPQRGKLAVQTVNNPARMFQDITVLVRLFGGKGCNGPSSYIIKTRAPFSMCFNQCIMFSILVTIHVTRGESTI